MPAYYWLIVVAVCILVELATMGLTSVWFAVGATVAYIVSLLGGETIVQIIVFLVVSLVALFITRPIAVKYFNSDRVKTNADSLIGREAVVVEKIDNVTNAGRVMVSGQEWAAQSKDGDVIDEKTIVVIESIIGVRLIVRNIKED
ncbi:MAG: NfeD family protein [Lachnospiraceae bacterium]|nr:NfeD family protein [Lachnospiraceae bacterium]